LELDKKKKKKKKKNDTRSTADEDKKAPSKSAARASRALECAAMSAVRHRLGCDAETAPGVVRGMESADRVAARHAFAVMERLATVRPRGAAASLVSRLSPTGPANLSDTLARVYLVRACGRLAWHPEIDVAMRAKFEAALGSYILDEREKVVFEAVAALCAGPWAALASGTIAGTKPLLPEIVIRISTALGSPSRPLLHAACRAAALLAEAYQRSRGEDTAHQFGDSDAGGARGPLDPLRSGLLMLLAHDCPFIRARAITALVWLADGSDYEVCVLVIVFVLFTKKKKFIGRC
jgi:hypothetical protein